MITVKEKYLKTITGLLAYYLNFYAVIYFRFKLQFKFKKNKNYSTIIVNMRAGLQ
jgi:hypothetical protein